MNLVFNSVYLLFFMDSFGEINYINYILKFKVFFGILFFFEL